MGQADIATARYLRRNEIFADMFNFFLYNGEEVLEPDSLQELDTREIEVPYGGTEGAEQPVKRTISDRKRVEVEERITEREYLTCLMDADPSRHPIRKTRYCFLYDNRYFELDVYPFWNNQAILELELSTEDEEVVLPKELELIREVTDDDAYKNASLAKNG